MFLETYNPFFLNVFWPNLPGAKNLSDFFFVKICQNDRNFSFFLPPPRDFGREFSKYQPTAASVKNPTEVKLPLKEPT